LRRFSSTSSTFSSALVPNSRPQMPLSLVPPA